MINHKKPIVIGVFSWTIPLLRQVHFKPLIGAWSIKQTVEEKPKMELDIRMWEGFHVSWGVASAPILAHYDPQLPFPGAGDTFAYKCGALISHEYIDGSEWSVTYASCTLSSSKWNYAQMEKETLSLIFGKKKFHSYLYGCKFNIYTDHNC